MRPTTIPHTVDGDTGATEASYEYEAFGALRSGGGGGLWQDD